MFSLIYFFSGLVSGTDPTNVLYCALHRGQLCFESLYRRYMFLHVAEGHVQTGDARLLIEEPGNL